ncbi:TlpA family protein disulfide reductase [Ensifer adhaerens]|uniref:TlpA family protein disulfide reductase n=1 Tax=Ensifer adhaerens TaxID=106592 RepID=UPI003F83F4B4
MLNDTPKPAPDVRFTDGDGQPHKLDDFHGKVVLLNVWATWCLPCRKEMPTLDRLQSSTMAINGRIQGIRGDDRR